MGLIGGGLVTPLGGAKTIQLNDSAGTDKLVIMDSDGFQVATIDSKGNLKLRGNVSKVTSQ